MAKIHPEIVKVIEEIKDNYVKDIMIIDQEFTLTYDELSQLIKALETNTSVRYIVLNYQRLSGTDAYKITQLFRLNTSISTLDLSNNNIGDMGAYYIAQLLKTNKSIAILDLGDNNISSKGAYHLAEMLKINNLLCTIYFTGNNIGDLGIKYLADALMINKTLDTINLYRTNITNDAVKLLTQSLLINKSLTCINMAYSEIKQDGFKALVQCFKVNKSLINIFTNNSFIDNKLQPLGENNSKLKVKIANFIYDMFADKESSDSEVSLGPDKSDEKSYFTCDIDSNRQMFKLYQRLNQKVLKKYLTDSKYVDGNFIIDKRVNPYIWHHNLEIMGVCKNLVKHIYNNSEEYGKHGDNSVGIWDLPVELIGYIFSFLD